MGDITILTKREELLERIPALTKEELLDEKLLAEILGEPDELKRLDYKSAAEARAKDLKIKMAFVEKYAAVAKILKKKDPKKENRIEGIALAADEIAGDERLGGIRYNAMSQSIWVHGKLPWRQDESDNREWQELDLNHLQAFMETEYGFSNAKKLEGALSIVSYSRRFNPIVEALEGLTWDGRDHISKLLPEFLGAEENELTAETMKLVMMGAINRVMSPGCKFDFTMVLSGPQGIGKSTFIKRLALEETWFTDCAVDFNADRPAEPIRGKWFVEFSELLSMRRAREAEAVKAFLTRTSDRMRLPYAKYVEDFPRTCVFIGSTNDASFLNDKSGARRFLPIEVGLHEPVRNLLKDEAEEEFRQAWAQAVEIYRSGNYTLTLPEHLLEAVEDARRRFTEEDPDQVEIEKWLADHPSIDRTCSAELYHKALGHVPSERMTQQDGRNINRIMSNLPGWRKTEKKMRFKDYGVVFGYCRIGANTEPVQLYMTDGAGSDSKFMDLSTIEEDDVPFSAGI